MIDQWNSLHNHFKWSKLDSMLNLKDAIKRAKEYGMKSMAITDHGVVMGIIEFYLACIEEDIKPILGCEIYLTEDMTIKSRAQMNELGNEIYHLILYAKDDIGLGNLYHIASAAGNDGYFDGYERIDLDYIRKHNLAEGIICTSACLGGPIASWLHNNKGRDSDRSKAETWVYELKNTFDDFYIELGCNTMALQRTVNAELIEIANLYNIPFIISGDTHYLDREDANIHEVLLCISTNSVMRNPDRFKFPCDDMYLLRPGEVYQYCIVNDIPLSAIENTQKIVDMCNANPMPKTKKGLLPPFVVDDIYTEDSFLEEMSYENLLLLAEKKPIDYKKYADRLSYELNIISSKGYSGYFLILWDIIAFCKRDPRIFTPEFKKIWYIDKGYPKDTIMTGPGRGCLSKDTNVVTPNGLIKINKLKVGDLVYDELGNQVAITDTFEYDCDEDLIEIKAFYGGNGDKMTSDHKVLVSKCNYTNKKRSSGYRYETTPNKLEWIRANEIEVNDLVVTPKLKFEDTLKELYIENDIYTRYSNKKSKFSANEISRDLNIDKTTAKSFLNCKLSHSNKSFKLINDHLIKNNTTLELVQSERLLVTKCNKHIEINYNSGFIFGLFISDGWLMSHKPNSIGFAVRRSTDDYKIPEIINNVFNVNTVHDDSKTRDLRQYYVHHNGIAELFRSIFKDYKYNAHSKYIPFELLNSNEDFRNGLLEGLWYGDGTHSSKSKYTTVSQRLSNDVLLLLGSLGLPCGIKEHRRSDDREEFYTEERIEYYITTSHNFEEIKNQCGVSYDGNFIYHRVREIKKVRSEGKVYDFTVPTTHSYVTDNFVVHNSAAGSIVSYLIGITKLDPIVHGLFFERFLDQEKDAFPDIDSDFEDLRRQEVIDYILWKHGEENTASIITCGTIKLKSGIRRIMKALDYTTAEIDEVAKSVPEKLPDQSDPDLTLFKDIRANPDNYKDDYGDKLDTVVKKVTEFWSFMNKYPDVENILCKLEGTISSFSVHAGGVIITPPGMLLKSIPTKYFESSKLPVCQFDMTNVEIIRALKLDILGLKTLSVIDIACRFAGIDKRSLDVENYDDYPEVYQIIRNGYTKHIFQLSSPGMTRMCNDIDISSFAELIDALALFRPGPLGAIDEATGLTMVQSYIEAKKTGIIPNIHKDIDHILSISKGCLVYQEQLMQIAQVIAGYTLGQADKKIRKPVCKKLITLFPTIKQEFVYGSKDEKDNIIVPGAIEQGYTEHFGSQLFEMMVKFGGYGFNKSHSACYADIAWKTAYIKAHNPAAYMAAVMTVYHSDIDFIIECIVECRKMGIDIFPPNINYSKPGFSLEKNKNNEDAIRYGLTAIKGVGQTAAEMIFNYRPYGSVKEFMDKVHDKSRPKEINPLTGKKINSPLSKRNEPVLIESGAFDELEPNRYTAINEYMAIRKEKDWVPLNDGKYNRKVTLDLEKKHIGTYISDHPLKNYPFTRWNDWQDGEKAEIGGIIRKIELKTNKHGETFATGTLETLEDKRRFILQSKVYQKNKYKLKKDERVILIGKKNEEWANINVLEIKLPRFMRKKTVVIEDMNEVDISIFGGETIGFEERETTT